MGWTGHFISPCPKGNERLRAVIDLEYRGIDILDGAMRGTTAYIVCRYGEHIWAEVALTEYRDGEFLIKTMSENMGPYAYDCPKRLLDLLPPTDSEFAKEWREACLRRIVAKRVTSKKGSALRKLPIGTHIRVKGYEDRTLTVGVYRGKRAYIDWARMQRWYGTTIERMGWEVIE